VFLRLSSPAPFCWFTVIFQLKNLVTEHALPIRERTSTWSPLDIVMDHVVSNGEYAGRLPSPPRTTIPPPLTVYTDCKAWSADVLPDYLKAYGWTLQNDVDTRQTEMFAWNYEDRRRAQFVAPFLALGPISAAKDATYLQEAGITMLLAIRQHRPYEARIMSAAANVAQGLGIEIQQIDVTNLQYLRSYLSQIVSSMANHLGTAPLRFNKLGKVLVACETGNERSAAVVVAFLVVSLVHSHQNDTQLTLVIGDCWS